MIRVTLATAILASAGALSSSASVSVLPNGWIVRAPVGTIATTGTMPQGAALSPDGSTLAVVESGFNPPALTLYATKNLRVIRRVALTGAFGRPVWTGRGILVAGANADAIFAIDPASGHVRTIALKHKSYPIAVAAHGTLVAVATNGDGSVRVGRLDALYHAHPVHVGEQLGPITFSPDGSRLFVAVRSGSHVGSIDAHTGALRIIATDLHPSDVLVVGRTLYVAHSDADTVGAYDAATGRRIRDIFVGTMPHLIGSSPNALSASGDAIYVSLGAANEVAVLRDGRVAARLPSGWYPTDALVQNNRLFIVDGKGDATKSNVGFNVMSRSNHDYIAAMQFGSVREIALGGTLPAPNPQGAQGARPPPAQTILRPGGPIQHVFFILKENRTYDQILGDMPQGNGDPKLVYFGAQVTPNQHAISQRFGLFDNFYTSGEVSDAGHNWADGAFANDYVERMWPPIYGGRNDDDRTTTGSGAAVASGGYMWDAARRAHVTFRDYGEMAVPATAGQPASAAPSLGDRFDPHYVGWDLDYSDVDRYKEWKREFDGFVSNNTLPQLEYLWVPNDHTAGIRPGRLTPAAYIAQNDYAVGLIVEAISHSKVWASSAVFITEDDAQDGADHVSNQRSTLYIASPYAAGGVIHDHFSTVSVLRTIEMLLGIKPLSTYDATAAPLYAAFDSTPKLKPYDATPPKIDLTVRNPKVARAGAVAQNWDLRGPDRLHPAMGINR